MPKKRDDDRVPVQIYIDPDFRHRLKILLATDGLTWGNLIIPHLEHLANRQTGDGEAWVTRDCAESEPLEASMIPRRPGDDRVPVPVQVLIEPDLHRQLKVFLAATERTWADIIIPHLEHYANEQHQGSDVPKHTYA